MDTSSETRVDAQSNPALLNKLAAEAMASSNEQEVMSVPRQVETPLPPDTHVELPGGLYDPFDGITTTAEVRELTGSDEEAIAKLNDTGKALLAILERATVKIGEVPATRDLLEGLLAGDREMLLLAIRKATFGNEVKIGPGGCPSCGEEQTFTVDLDADVEIKKINEDDRQFVLDCKVGKVSVSLPTGATQRALVTSGNKNAAELDTLLLKGCISSINGKPVINNQQVKDLGVKDRRAIIEAITTRNPGPQLSEIIKTCMSCGQEVPLPLTLADLFRE